MLLTVTDFGTAGPYLGQLKAAVLAETPGAPILDLLTAAPAFDPVATGYLLAALLGDLPEGCVVLGVVDPGVGTARRPVIVKAGTRFFVGPDNGLFAPVLNAAGGGAAWRIDWRPPRLSASFHGRDLFAPVAARLLRGEPPAGRSIDPDGLVGRDLPPDRDAIIFVDVYGNAMTGRRACTLPPGTRLRAGGHLLTRAETFGAVPPGTPLWYENANGLVECAVNLGRAESCLGLAVGDPVTFETPD